MGKLDIGEVNASWNSRALGGGGADPVGCVIREGFLGEVALKPSPDE